MSSSGVYVKLADNLEPQSTVGKLERRKKQSKLFERWTRQNDVTWDKIFKLGSEETVSYSWDKGLFSALEAAYSNHCTIG